MKRVIKIILIMVVFVFNVEQIVYPVLYTTPQEVRFSTLRPVASRPGPFAQDVMASLKDKTLLLSRGDIESYLRRLEAIRVYVSPGNSISEIEGMITQLQKALAKKDQVMPPLGQLGLQISLDGLQNFDESELSPILMPQELDIATRTRQLIIEEGQISEYMLQLANDDATNITKDIVTQAAYAGDEVAVAVIEKLAREIAIVMYDSATMYGARALFFGVTDKRLEHLLLKRIKRYLEKEFDVQKQSTNRKITIHSIDLRPAYPSVLTRPAAKQEVSLEGYTLGVDIGGTFTKIVLAKNGKEIGRAELPTLANERKPVDTLREIRSKAVVLLRNTDINPTDIMGVGVCAPGIQDWQGYPTFMPGFPNEWKKVSLKEAAPEGVNATFCFSKDGNGSAAGEHYVHELTNSMMLAVGTGVGGALIINGQLIRGENTNAATLGHLIVEKDPGVGLPHRKVATRRGVINRHASASGITHYASLAIESGGKGVLADRFRDDLESMTAKDVGEAAVRGDVLALEVFNKVTDYLTFGIFKMYVYSKKEVKDFIIAGGVSEADAGALFVKLLSEKLKGRYNVEDINIHQAKLGQYAGATGMAVLALQNAARHQNAFESARELIRTEAEAIRRLVDKVDDNFKNAVERLCKVSHEKGKVIITAVDDERPIAEKIAASLASLGISANFCDPNNTQATIHENDVVMIVSYSGEQRQLIEQYPWLKGQSKDVIILTGKPDSSLAGKAEEEDIVLNIGIKKEAGPFGLVPTTSTTATLAFADALAIAASNRIGFGRLDFGLRHPGGSLGEELRRSGKLDGYAEESREERPLEKAIEEAKRALEIEADTVAKIEGMIAGDDFKTAVNMCLYSCHSYAKTVVIGLGKTGHIGEKTALTLGYMGIPSIFMHADEALHGDAGMIEDVDTGLAISNSGESREITSLMPWLHIRHIKKLIAMTQNPESSLAKASKVVLQVPSEKGEADPLGLAPTASSTAALAAGDALATALAIITGYQLKDLYRLHPQGERLIKQASRTQTSPLELIKKHKTFAVATRSLTDPKKVIEAAKAAVEGGIRLLEITLPTPGAFDIIKALSQEYADRGDVVIAAGTVKTSEDVNKAADNGAQIIFSPVLDEKVVEEAQRRGLLVAPGTRSNAEIQRAIKLGVDFIKIFPTDYGDTPQDYLNAILPPLPELEDRDVKLVTDVSEVPEGAYVGTTPNEILEIIHKTKSNDTIYIIPPEEKGTALLKRVSDEFPGVAFSPTAGIKPENLTDILNVGGVATTGLGSAIYDKEAVMSGNRTEVRERAQRIAGIVISSKYSALQGECAAEGVKGELIEISQYFFTQCMHVIVTSEVKRIEQDNGSTPQPIIDSCYRLISEAA